MIRSLVGKVALVGLSSAVLILTAPAQMIPVQNAGFESPDAFGSFLELIPDFWTPDGAAATVYFVEDTASVGMTGGDGIQYAGIRAENGYMFQDLGVPFEANATYHVEVATAHRAGFTHGTLEFGLFSSNDIGIDLGTVGFADIQGVWTGSGNPDADDMFNVFRDSADLAKIGSGLLGQPYSFVTDDPPPSGNVVVFMRLFNPGNEGFRVNLDQVRVEVTKGGGLIGDVNCDGAIDLLDVTPFVNVLTSGEYQFKADINQDGVVNLLDVAPFVDLLSGG